MKKATSVPVILSLLAAGCGGAQQPVAQPGKSTSPAASGRATAAPAPLSPGQAPEADLGGEILGTLTVTSLDRLLEQGFTLVRGHLPPALQAMVQPDSLRAQLFKALKAPELASALDTSRPLALAMADPEVYKGNKLGPVLLAVPVQEPDGLLAFLGRKAQRHETTPWQDHLFELRRETIRVRLQDGYALVATHDRLLSGAARTLLPLVQSPPAELAVLRVNMATIYHRFGDQIEKAVAKVQGKLARENLDKISIGKTAARWAGFVKGMEEIRWVLSLESAQLASRFSITARPGGALATYLGSLNAGQAWGLQYLPKDSGVVVALRDDPGELIQGITDAESGARALFEGKVDPSVIAAWGDTLRRSLKHFSGETAISLWASPDGGIGLAAATRLRDGPAAQAGIRQLVQFISKELLRLQTKVLKEVIKKEAPGLRLTFKARPGGIKLGKVKADLYELDLRFPRPKDKETRRALAELRKSLNKVIGPRFQLAFVAVGDVGLWAMGKDLRRRLADMAAIAQGGKGTGMEQTVGAYGAGKKMTMLLYCPLATLLEQILRVADRVTTVPAEIKELASKVLPGPGVDVPLAGVVHLRDRTYILEAQVSTQVVGMIARGAMHQLTTQGRGPMGVPIPTP